MTEENIVCFVPNCDKIPIIHIENNNSFEVKIICDIHKEKIMSIKEYLSLCNNYIKDKLCDLCHKKLPDNNFNFYCNSCNKYFDAKCYYKSNCNKNNHRINKIKNSNNNINNNMNNNINVKSKNDLDYLNNIIKSQEEIFLKEKRLVLNYLNEIQNELQLKRKIFENYKNNKNNKNALNNLNNLKLSLDKKNFEKINDILNKDFNNINNEDKAMSLYYYNQMCKKKENLKKDDDLDFSILNLSNNLNPNLNKKMFLEDNNNININPINIIHNNNNNNQRIIQNNNNNQGIIQNNNDNNNIDPFILQDPKLKLVSSISGKNKIYTLILLHTGNIALGFSSGIIKIYKLDKNLLLLLEISKFKGRRINYLYELKDNTLLCCTYGKIHHIILKNNDTKFEYLGTINLSKFEIPKKIIELGDNLIISLGEKNIRKDNYIKKRCILKIFNKINSGNKSNLNKDNYLSDCESLNSINSANSDWESIFSNDEGEEEDDVSLNNYSLLQEQIDESIKIYKNDKNFDKIFICTIFGINVTRSRTEDTYEFVASSNSIYKDGENSLLFYGLTKIKNRNGYQIFIRDNKIKNLACSQNIDSICFLDKEKIKIGIALQNFNEADFDGIAVVNIKKYELEKIIRGASIGILKMNKFNKKNIIFVSNKTNDKKKLDKLMTYEYHNTSKNLDNKRMICCLKKGCLGFIEIIKENKEIYIIHNIKEIFVIEYKL